MSPSVEPVFGALAWIDVVLLSWFALVPIAVAFFARDVRSTAGTRIIKWSWILTTLYLGPIAVAFYVLAGKERCSRCASIAGRPAQ